MAADPTLLPTLDEWNATKLAEAFAGAGYTPSGVKCPLGTVAHELFDVTGSETKSDSAGVVLGSVKVICPSDGFKGERYL